MEGGWGARIGVGGLGEWGWGKLERAAAENVEYRCTVLPILKLKCLAFWFKESLFTFMKI